MTTARSRIPLSLQVIVAVICGAALGGVYGHDPYWGGLRNEDLGRFGMAVITVLKTLAVPLIFFAILDACVRISLPLRQGTRLLGICLINVSVAMVIGLTIMNTWQPGLAWVGHVEEWLPMAALPGQADLHALSESPGPFEQLLRFIPDALLHPFSSHGVIGVVLLALALGTVLRRALVEDDGPTGARTAVVKGIERTYQFLVQCLEWIILVVPFAVFGVVAQVVGKSGVSVFSFVWVFLAAMLAGLALHSLVYYPLVAWIIGKKPPRIFLGQGADAVMTGISCNSSLATVPVTLRSLDRMGVSPQSARLAACVGTNLNNDGITLYEAMAALFLAQALGFDLPLTNQFLIVIASIIAGAGVAGIPEAGLVVLPLVLSAAGLQDQIIAAAVPLIMTVDWIIARARSGVNVMSDLQVAIVLDRGRRGEQPTAEPHPVSRPSIPPQALPPSI